MPVFRLRREFAGIEQPSAASVFRLAVGRAPANVAGERQYRDTGEKTPIFSNREAVTERSRGGCSEDRRTDAHGIREDRDDRNVR